MALLLQLTQQIARGFDFFWSRYPEKKAKKDAIKAWGQVVKDDPKIEAQIHAALDWQIPHWDSLDWYTPPLPASYLRGERFTDERPAPPKPKAPQAVVTRFSQSVPQTHPVSDALRQARARLDEEWGQQ